MVQKDGREGIFGAVRFPRDLRVGQKLIGAGRGLSLYAGEYMVSLSSPDLLPCHVDQDPADGVDEAQQDRQQRPQNKAGQGDVFMLPVPV